MNQEEDEEVPEEKVEKEEDEKIGVRQRKFRDADRTSPNLMILMDNGDGGSGGGRRSTNIAVAAVGQIAWVEHKAWLAGKRMIDFTAFADPRLWRSAVINAAIIALGLSSSLL